ncbi:rolling circle replication-associated protein [Mycobacterium parmense]
MTYPGDCETVARGGASVKRHVALWCKRFQCEWGEPARYIWKLEFQRRGAPHIHLRTAPPHGVSRSGRTFRDWLSQECWRAALAGGRDKGTALEPPGSHRVRPAIGAVGGDPSAADQLGCAFGDRIDSGGSVGRRN